MDLNAFGLVLTEKQIIPSATVDDIDFGAVRAYMQAQGLDVNESPQPAREDDLRNARWMTALTSASRRACSGTMRQALRRFNGTEPELVNDERNRLVRVTFQRGVSGR